MSPDTPRYAQIPPDTLTYTQICPDTLHIRLDTVRDAQITPDMLRDLVIPVLTVTTMRAFELFSSQNIADVIPQLLQVIEVLSK